MPIDIQVSHFFTFTLKVSHLTLSAWFLVKLFRNFVLEKRALEQLECKQHLRELQTTAIEITINNLKQ
jgi:hypothetical protein